MRPLHVELLLLASLTACGGKVFVDSPGSATGAGGAGGAGSGAGGSCAAALQDLDLAISNARTCDPSVNIQQCTGQATVPDECGCTVVLNEQNIAAVSAAASASMNAQAAGCIKACGTPCPPLSAICLPDPNGSTGHCEQPIGD